MEIKNNLAEIKAEMLLNYLFPEKTEVWIARHRSAFYRGYNQDILSLDEENDKLELARNGYLKLLPREMMAPGEEARNGKSFEEIGRRIELVEEAFLPLDAFAFRNSLKIEKQVAELLEERFEYLLRTYFDIDIDKITNPMLRRAVTLLPSVSKHRGNLDYIRGMLKVIVGCEVMMSTGKYSEGDSSKAWVPMVRYDLMIDGLTKTKYAKKLKEITPLVDFIREWYMPVEVEMIVKIKGRGKGNLLEYNL